MQYPLINGRRYSFASITLTVKGKTIVGFKEIAYAQTLEPGVVRGAHAEVLGTTRGDLENEASFTPYAEEAYELLSALGDGYLEQTFDISVSYAEEGNATITDKLIGCRLKKVDASHSQGTDGLEKPMELYVQKILLNGKEALKKPLKN